MKTGDRVVLARKSFPMNAQIGATGTVGPEGAFLFSPPGFKPHMLLDINWDRNDLAGAQNNGGYYIEDFDLIDNNKNLVVNYLQITKEIIGR